MYEMNQFLSVLMSVWQQPYVNVFKHFQVHTWKKSSKEGDVDAVMV